MYVFISHSSIDKPYVRKLTDSLSFYGIPVFLDEKVIKVGDNIPERIYEAIEKCTHLIYVLSKNSIASKWVNEELSAAKVRYLSTKCLILPVLIDNVDLPTSVNHIKYANFQNWKIKESYLEGLKELLEALNINLNSYTSSSELLFFQKYLKELVQLKAIADKFGQIYFQLERLWFEVFERDSYYLSASFNDIVSKTIDIEEFRRIYELFGGKSSEMLQNNETVNRLLNFCKAIDQSYIYMSLIPADQDSQLIYAQIQVSERQVRELSAHLYAVLLEIQSISLIHVNS